MRNFFRCIFFYVTLFFFAKILLYAYFTSLFQLGKRVDSMDKSHNIFFSKDVSEYRQMSVESVGEIRRIGKIYIINEKDLDLSSPSTWTSSRNNMLDAILREENLNQQKWNFLTFVDGDIEVDCKVDFSSYNLIDRKVISQYFSIVDSSSKFRHSQYRHEKNCFVYYDLCLFEMQPALANMKTQLDIEYFQGLFAQVVFHVDAMLHTFHRDVISLVLPYCELYDKTSWWTSQAILLLRSLCVFGYAVQLNRFHIQSNMKHRSYPRQGDPWKMIKQRFHPSFLDPLSRWLGNERKIYPILPHTYHRWNRSIASSECMSNFSCMERKHCTFSSRSACSSIMFRTFDNNFST